MAKDLRLFLNELGDLMLRINQPVDPVTQIGVLCSESRGPIMFENLVGFPNWKLVDILVKSRETQAIALGTTPDKILSYLASCIYEKGPGKSVIISDGPCKEIKLLGNEADLTKLPIPIHSIGDAGRYLGSGVTITKDPDTGVRNEAFLRTWIREPRRVPFRMMQRHNWNHLMKYKERGEPMPIAHAIGLHPAYEIMANFSGRHDTYDELELGAGVLNETLEMVKCETIDLEVPAHAEIIIEGLVYPDVWEPEGPFGEFTGYGGGESQAQAPVIEVTAITHRRDPIFRHCQATVFTDHQALVSVPIEATLYRRLSDVHGYTEIHDVYMPNWAGNFIVFVQLTSRYDGQARDVLLAALSSQNLHPKIVVAVDQDVDIYDPKQVFWAISTRVNPEKDVIIIPNERIHNLDISVPYADYGPKASVNMRIGGKMGIDATKPPLNREVQRKNFSIVSPMGKGDPSLEELLKLVR